MVEARGAPALSVVIPNWNGARLLPLCLGSLERQTARNFEAIVVDNGSSDGSPELVAARYPWARLVRLPQAVGFARAVNAGVRKARADLIALLNNDTEVAPGWVSELVEAMRRRPEAGWLASKMLDFRRRDRIDSAGHAMTPDGLPFSRGQLGPDGGEYDREKEVLGACGGAAAYRRSLLERVGLFDEDFESIYEDVDFDLRAQLLGARCWYAPAAVVYHIGSATIGRRSERNIYYSTRNLLLLWVKALPTAILLRRFFLLLRATVRAAVFHALRGRAKASLLGQAAALPRIPRFLRKRRQVQRASKLTTADFEARLRLGIPSP
jgi:GT2 family glycosyltransferase